MNTNVYIDGFNLYYRALKDTRFRWLDLQRLSETLFPDSAILQINYFTARLRPRPDNPGQPQRQLTYIRALHTLDNLKIYYGTFRHRTKRRRLVGPLPGLPTYVEVEDWEEKGTDVNLATRLLVDGFRGGFEQAVVLSNDSDLASPIRYVRDELGIRVVVVNPDARNNAHEDLAKAATYVKSLWKSHLRRSQFQPTLYDDRGTIVKPESW